MQGHRYIPRNNIKFINFFEKSFLIINTTGLPTLVYIYKIESFTNWSIEKPLLIKYPRQNFSISVSLQLCSTSFCISLNDREAPPSFFSPNIPRNHQSKTPSPCKAFHQTPSRISANIFPLSRNTTIPFNIGSVRVCNYQYETPSSLINL